MKTLVLGSNSPRRKELLQLLGFSFVTRVSNLDEVIPTHIPNGQAAEYLAIQKNKAIQKATNEVVLTADTTVLLDKDLLEKPTDSAEAKDMLARLSGKTHQVITGVCISSENTLISFSSTTEVVFHELTKSEIAHYVDTFQPLDKAGGYGIQEWIGMVAIKQLKGSYHNVMGLPVDMVYHELVNKFAIMPFK